MAIQFTAQAAGLVRETWTLVTTPGTGGGDGGSGTGNNGEEEEEEQEEHSSNNKNNNGSGEVPQVIELHGLGSVEDFRVAPAREDIGAAVASRVLSQKMEDLVRELVSRVQTPPPAEGTDEKLTAAHQHAFESHNIGRFYSPPAYVEAVELSRLLHRDVEDANDDEDWDVRLSSLSALLDRLPDDDQDKADWQARYTELRRRCSMRAPEVSSAYDITRGCLLELADKVEQAHHDSFRPLAEVDPAAAQAFAAERKAAKLEPQEPPEALDRPAMEAVVRAAIIDAVNHMVSFRQRCGL